MTVRLDGFEGPFELLFHLIEKNKMDIRDIRISVLAEQYMEYLFNADIKDMDDMSGFLLMAATLLELKCRLLLPSAAAEDEEDPKRVLMEMLAEYARFREASDTLREMGDGAGQSLYKERESSVFDLFGGYFEIQPPSGLFEAYLTAMKNRRPPSAARPRSETGYINREGFNIKIKMEYIRRLIKTRRRIMLSSLFNESGGREEMAVIFQGLLLLIRDDAVGVAQERTFGEIIITAGGRG